MKVKIPAIMGRSDAAEYVRLMLRVYEGVYLDLNDIGECLSKGFKGT